MFPRTSTHTKRIIAILSQRRRPSQVAFGIAIGLMLGLVPKDNLVAVSLVLLIAFAPINQLLACTSAIVMYLFSGMLDPVTSFIGTSMLQIPLIAGLIVFSYQFPLMPWTCLEIPLVIGGIGMGLITLAPNYAICRWSLSKMTRKIEQRALEQVANHAIEYRKTVADQSRMRQDKPATPLKLVSEMDDGSVAGVVSKNDTGFATVQAPETAEPLPQQQPTSDIERGTSRRAARKIQQRVLPTIFTGDSHFEGNDTILRETVIEVVRYRSPNALVKQTANTSPNANALTSTQGTSMPAGNASTANAKDASSNAFATANAVSTSKATTTTQSISFDSGHVPGVTSNRDESLRYLLWHINGSRENVRKSSEKTA